MKNLILSLLILSGFFSAAQSIKEVDVDYMQVKLPMVVLPASVKNYKVTMLAPYEDKNKQLIAQYKADQKTADEDYAKAIKKYDIDYKQAEKRYADEMEEYRKKSVGKKLVEKSLLNENTKPVKDLPSKPYPVTVPKPELQTEYDLPVLADSYIKLENFTKGNDNAVAIIVTLYGYDFTNPVMLSEQGTRVNLGQGNVSAGPGSYAYIEYSYRRPMAVRIVSPDGKELLSLTPQQLNAYKVSRTQNTQNINRDLIVKANEEKSLQEGLQTINRIVNDKFGSLKEKRTAELSYVKKDDAYGDLLTAFNEASSALKTLADDEAGSKVQLTHAVGLWNTALAESDLKDKKARINKDVTIAVCFNLLEVNLALRDVAGGTAVLQKMNSIELSNRERSKKNQYEAEFTDLKKRLQAN